MNLQQGEIQYAGFWIRLGAALIDSVLIMIVVASLLHFVYGEAYWESMQYSQGIWDVIVNYVLPAIAVVLFWVYRSATPGKMLLKLEIVDARTGDKPSSAQFIGRYLAYYVSILPLMLGLFWVGIDKRKQGFHDKLAKTVVIRKTETASGDWGNSA